MNTRGGHERDGFTLVELLIVIVILGVLATVTVLAVRGIHDKGQASACAADHRIVVGAEEAYMAEHAGYGAMNELVSAGRLRAASTHFNVTVTPAKDDYSLAGIGPCVNYAPGASSLSGGGAGAGGGGAGAGGALGSALGVADTTTYAGMDALSYSAAGATRIVVIIDNGSGSAVQDFEEFIALGAPHPGVNLILVDAASRINGNATPGAVIDEIIAMHPDLIANYAGTHDTETSAALNDRHQFYLLAAYAPISNVASVMRYYDDFLLGQIGGVPITYAGLPAVQFGSPTALHQLVVFPHGTGGDAVKAEFSTLGSSGVLPADVAVTMIALSQWNDTNQAFQPWEIDAVLAQSPSAVAAGADMRVSSADNLFVPIISYVGGSQQVGQTVFVPISPDGALDTAVQNV